MNNSETSGRSAAATPELSRLDIKAAVTQAGQQARDASAILAQTDPQAKNQALIKIAHYLHAERQMIRHENALDLQQATKDGLNEAMIDRLLLSDARIDAMIEGLHQIEKLPDPVGEISDMSYRPSGIQVGKMRVPLGVIGIIYESRPNVTIDAAALCLKSGNACILRGGKEALRSNLAIYQCIQQGLRAVGLAEHCVQVIDTADRKAVDAMLTLVEYIDVIIPRGGTALVERIARDSVIPSIKHLCGICHVFIDATADTTKALDIALNAKTRRYGVCNAMETLLISDTIASRVLPSIIQALMEKGVEVRGCEKTIRISAESGIKPASPADWSSEYLAPILAIKIVATLEAAINHINHYGSHHTDAIVTEDYSRAREFLRRVDSSSVMVNASTAFGDGFEYGLGAEIGVSTNKLHARGPVGLEGLTSQKYIVFGNGHIRP